MIPAFNYKDDDPSLYMKTGNRFGGNLTNILLRNLYPKLSAILFLSSFSLSFL